MQISAIKYQVIHEGKPRIYRFQGQGGPAKNIAIHLASSSELADFQQAILWAITGQSQPRIQDVVLHAADNNGESWIIERTPERTRVFRNRQPVVEPAEAQFINALLDADYGDTSSTKALARVHTVEMENGQYYGFVQQQKDEGLYSADLRAEVKKECQNLVQQIQEFLGSKAFIDPTIAQKLRDGLEPIALLYREIRNEEKKIIDETQKIAQLEPEQIHRLEQEVALNEKLRQKASPLLDPARNPALLKEKLQETENQLNTLLRKNDIPQLPMLNSDVPWEKVLMTLSRMKAYEQLQTAYDSCFQQIDHKITPLFQEYIVTITDLLQNDTQITSELECCLATLSMQMQKTEPQPPAPTKALWSGLLDKLTRPNEESTSLVPAVTDPHSRLENARLAVDYALGRLGELHSNLAALENLNIDAKNQLRDFYEKLVGEFGKLKKNWEILATRYQLPKECSLKTLLNIMQHYAQIGELVMRRDRCRQELQSYRSELQDLEKMVLEWRQLTGSQKQSNLDNPAILLSEARGILEYQEQKSAHLRKLKDQEQKVTANLQLLQHLKQRMMDMQIQWRQVFERLALPVKDLSNPAWPEMFQVCSRMVCLTKMIRNLDQTVRNEQIFSSQQLEHLLNVFYWHDCDPKAPATAAMLKTLDRTPEERQVIILTTSPGIQEFLAASLSCAKTVAFEPQRKKSPATTASATSATIEPTTKSKPILSERAAAALRVFQTHERRNVHGSTRDKNSD